MIKLNANKGERKASAHDMQVHVSTQIDPKYKARHSMDDERLAVSPLCNNRNTILPLALCTDVSGWKTRCLAGVHGATIPLLQLQLHTYPVSQQIAKIFSSILFVNGTNIWQGPTFYVFPPKIRSSANLSHYKTQMYRRTSVAHWRT